LIQDGGWGGQSHLVVDGICPEHFGDHRIQGVIGWCNDCPEINSFGRGAINGERMTDEIPIVPSAPVSNTILSTQFHGKTHAQQGVHLVVDKPQYAEPEVQNLYERLQKKFKDMGVDDF
jgi:hypothetical protein